MIKPKFCAEIAKTCQGRMDLARASILEAKAAGYDYVKFQSYDLNDLNPQHENFDKYCKSHFTIDQLKELKDYATENSIGFYCSTFSKSQIKPLSEFTDIIKVPSTFLPYSDFVHCCLDNFSECHVSTGFYPEDTIRECMAKYKTPNTNVVFYGCTSLYPTPNNLLRLSRIKELGLKGFSYHGQSMLAVALAVKGGAEYIELHFSPFMVKPWIWNTDQSKVLCSYLQTCRDMHNNSAPSDAELKSLENFKKEYKDLQ